MRSGGGNMSTPQPATASNEPVRLKYGMRDTVAIHAGTAQLISDLIDRVFVVDYHMVFVAPDLTPLPVAAPVPEPTIEPDRERRSPRLTSRTREKAARRDAQMVPVDQSECAAAAQ